MHALYRPADTVKIWHQAECVVALSIKVRKQFSSMLSVNHKIIRMTIKYSHMFMFAK